MNQGIQKRRAPRLHLPLFLLTLLTTTLAGAWQSGADPFSDPRQLASGLPFAATLMTILLVHEMGHYLMSRYHGVQATLPYFIPGPALPPPFISIGTFGAFIKMQSPPLDRRALFDVAAAGPLAGLVLAIPAVIMGLHLSTLVPEDGTRAGITLGSSLLLNFLSLITLGFLPNQPDVTIVMHPIGFAGWVGLLVTAMNLLPVGQLDGGHVAYALFGQRYIWIARLALVTILFLGLLRWWDGWLIWGLLLLFMGVRHPPPLDPYTPLDLKRRFLGWLMLAILAVTFIPAPFTVQEPGVQRERVAPKAAPSPKETRLNGGLP